MNERKTPASKDQTAEKLAALSMEHLAEPSPVERKKKVKAFEDAVKRAVSDSRTR